MTAALRMKEPNSRTVSGQFTFIGAATCWVAYTRLDCTCLDVDGRVEVDDTRIWPKAGCSPHRRVWPRQRPPGVPALGPTVRPVTRDLPPPLSAWPRC